MSNTLLLSPSTSEIISRKMNLRILASSSIEREKGKEKGRCWNEISRDRCFPVEIARFRVGRRVRIVPRANSRPSVAGHPMEEDDARCRGNIWNSDARIVSLNQEKCGPRWVSTAKYRAQPPTCRVSQPSPVTAPLAPSATYVYG